MRPCASFRVAEFNSTDALQTLGPSGTGDRVSSSSR